MWMLGLIVRRFLSLGLGEQTGEWFARGRGSRIEGLIMLCFFFSNASPVCCENNNFST